MMRVGRGGRWVDRVGIDRGSVKFIFTRLQI